MRFKIVLLQKKWGLFEEYLISYKEDIGKRVNPFDNKNVAKRAIIALNFLGALFLWESSYFGFDKSKIFKETTISCIVWVKLFILMNNSTCQYLWGLPELGSQLDSGGAWTVSACEWAAGGWHPLITQSILNLLDIRRWV